MFGLSAGYEFLLCESVFGLSGGYEFLFCESDGTTSPSFPSAPPSALVNLMKSMV